VDALRRLVSAGPSVREAADRLGVPYYEARSLLRAADVADALQGQGVEGKSRSEM
jgi:hypothetical protein